MIDLTWRKIFRRDVEQRLYLIHEDLTRWAELMRDPTVEVWARPLQPPEGVRSQAELNAWARNKVSASGWAEHLVEENARLSAYLAQYGTELLAHDPEAHAALVEYVSDAPAIVATMRATLDKEAADQLATEARAEMADGIEVFKGRASTR